VVDFTNTIIIATSNLGADIIQRNLKKRGTKEFDEGRQKAELMEVLRGHFRPEFINRIDEIIVFHALNQTEIRRIVELPLDRVKRTAQGQGVALDFDLSVVDHFAAVGFRPEYGARELRRLIRSELETTLAREMLSGRIGDGDRVRVAWSAEDQKITFDRIAPPAPDGNGQGADPAAEPGQEARIAT
jgi:ATP-dependent Clp protease ATP-binding subunit ClpC